MAAGSVRDHVFTQLTQEQINESRLSLLEVINNEPDDRETADMTNVASTSKAVLPALTAVEESCVSVTTKPTSPDDTSIQQVRRDNELQCLTDNLSCYRCRKSLQDTLFDAYCALDDLDSVYLQNIFLWRDKLVEAIDASAGSRILACNFRTPHLQLWWKYIFAYVTKYFDTQADKPIVCVMSCSENTEPMHLLQSLLTAIGVGEAHSICSIEQCLAELEASLVHRNGSSSSSKVIFVLQQIHRLAGLGDAGIMVLKRLLQLTQTDKSRFILVGLTSQAALPLSIQQLTQEKDCVKPVMLTDEEAAQIEAHVQDAIGNILVPAASCIVRQWIEVAGSWIPVAVEFCCDVLRIAWYQKVGALVNEQQLIAAYRDWRPDLEAVRPYLSWFKHSQLAYMLLRSEHVAVLPYAHKMSILHSSLKVNELYVVHHYLL
eukprot:8613-Heterococcus_DN1.PRE.1